MEAAPGEDIVPSVGPAEILVIVVVALLVFGPSRLPEIGRQVGKALRDFQQFQDSLRDEVRDVLDPVTGGGAAPTLPPLPPGEAEQEGEPGSDPEATANEPAPDEPGVVPVDADHTGPTDTEPPATGEPGAEGASSPPEGDDESTAG